MTDFAKLVTSKESIPINIIDIEIKRSVDLLMKDICKDDWIIDHEIEDDLELSIEEEAQYNLAITRIESIEKEFLQPLKTYRSFICMCGMIAACFLVITASLGVVHKENVTQFTSTVTTVAPTTSKFVAIVEEPKLGEDPPGNVNALTEIAELKSNMHNLSNNIDEISGRVKKDEESQIVMSKIDNLKLPVESIGAIPIEIRDAIKFYSGEAWTLDRDIGNVRVIAFSTIVEEGSSAIQAAEKISVHNSKILKLFSNVDSRCIDPSKIPAGAKFQGMIKMEGEKVSFAATFVNDPRGRRNICREPAIANFDEVGYFERKILRDTMYIPQAKPIRSSYVSETRKRIYN